MTNHIGRMPPELQLNVTKKMSVKDTLATRACSKALYRVANSALVEHILRLKKIEGLDDVLNITPADSLKSLDASSSGVEDEHLHKMLDDGHRFKVLMIKDHSAGETAIRKLMNTQKCAEELDLSVKADKRRTITLSASSFPSMEDNHSLKKLNLSGFILQPECLSQISKCPVLEELSLCDTRLTGEHLKTLRPINDALKVIDISENDTLNTEITQKEMLAFIREVNPQQLFVSVKQVAVNQGEQRRGFHHATVWSFDHDILSECKERNIDLCVYVEKGKIHHGHNIPANGILTVTSII